MCRAVALSQLASSHLLHARTVETGMTPYSTVQDYSFEIFPALVSTKVGSTNFSRVLAYSYSRTRVPAYFCVLAYCVILRTVTFTQTPVQVRRKITFAAPAQNSSYRPYRFFKRTRAVLIYGRPASYRRIVCLVFAHGVQT